MQNHRLLVFFGLFLAVICGFSGASALAATPLAITATNVTMPSSGNGTSLYMITGIPAAGTVTISCLFTGTPTKANIPNCTYNTSFTAIPVTAGQTLTGTVNFYAFGHLPAAGMALVGGLMLGFGFRRKLWRWLAVAVLALGTIAGVIGLNGCGGKGTIYLPTPGTYQYTIYANYVDSVNPIGSAILQANVNVTVQ
jgi:hypothetical protein